MSKVIVRRVPPKAPKDLGVYLDRARALQASGRAGKLDAFLRQRSPGTRAALSAQGFGKAPGGLRRRVFPRPTPPARRRVLP